MHIPYFVEKFLRKTTAILKTCSCFINQVAKVQLALDFGFCRELPVFFVVAINVFKDVTIEFFFGANQRLNATLESKSQIES